MAEERKSRYVIRKVLDEVGKIKYQVDDLPAGTPLKNEVLNLADLVSLLSAELDATHDMLHQALYGCGNGLAGWGEIDEEVEILNNGMNRIADAACKFFDQE